MKGFELRVLNFHLETRGEGRRGGVREGRSERVKE